MAVGWWGMVRGGRVEVGEGGMDVIVWKKGEKRGHNERR